MSHSKECQEAFAQYKKTVVEYETAWPDYCKKCNGWNGTPLTYDPATFNNFEVDPCSECFMKRLCPRCQGKIDSKAKSENCLHCGYSFLYGEGLPSKSKCFCFCEDNEEDFFESSYL